MKREERNVNDSSARSSLRRLAIYARMTQNPLLARPQKGETMSHEELRTEQPEEEEESWREMRRRERRPEEKEEKEEKEEEKTEKEEKWTRDPLSGVTSALILIVAGAILLVESLGILLWYGSAWNVILIAAGLILLLQAALRLVVPAYRRPVLGTLVFAFILLSIGLGGFFGRGVTWPLFLIIAGLAIIISGLLKGRL